MAIRTVASAQRLDGGGVDIDRLKAAPPDDPLGLDFPMPQIVAPIPPAATAAYQRGKSLVDDGKAVEALRELYRAVELAPNFAEAQLALGAVLDDLGQHRRAIAAFTVAINAGGAGIPLGDVYFARGKAHLEAGEIDMALEDFTAAVRSAPTNSEYLTYQGKAFLQMATREYAEGLASVEDTIGRAIASFDLAIALSPQNVEALTDRAAAKADLGQLDEALADVQKAAKLRPNDAGIQHQLGLLHLRRASATDEALSSRRTSDLQAAVAALDNALAWFNPGSDDFDPDEARLTRAVASIELATLLKAGQRAALYKSSLADCDRVIADNPTLALAHFHRGVALRLLGRFAEAVDAFTQCLRLNPANNEARIRRGIAWYYQDELDLAAGDFRSVGLIAGDARPDFWLGVIHSRRGEHLDAIRSYSAALKENRDFRLAYVNRGLAYMRLCAWERAIDDLNKLILLDPHDAQAYFRLGLVQKRLGEKAAARESFSKAIQFDPGHELARAHLAK